MASFDKELEEQLLEAGKSLANPPSSVDQLLPLLDQVEDYLLSVEQSPTKSMRNALLPSLKALVADQLFRHSNVDVKVAVASCISEITRITAPDAPYDDDQMRNVFQLIVSSFKDLADKSSRSYSKRISILETVAKVRSCLVMLDLECDELIIEMFQHFLRAIRDYHPENVFSSMETIMTLVLEESEEISVELLSPSLNSVKRSNEDVLPIARKLGEKVLENCATKVKPYLIHAVKSLGISLDDYSEIVASICQETYVTIEQNDVPVADVQETCVTIEQNDVHVADENKVEESKPVGASSQGTAQDDKEIAAEVVSPLQDDLAKSPKSVVSNGVAQTGDDDSLADLNSSKNERDCDLADMSKNVDVSSNAETGSLDAEKFINAESKPEHTSKKRGKKVNSLKMTEVSDNSYPDAEEEIGKLTDDKSKSKDVSSSPCEDPSNEVALSSENQEVTGTEPSSAKALESESPAVSSPSASKSHPDECLSEQAGQPQKKEMLMKADDVPKKTAEGTTGSEAKPREAPSGIFIENWEPITTKASEKETDTASDVEDKPLKQLSKKMDKSSKDGDGSSKKDKRKHQGKAILGRGITKISAKDVDREKVSSPKSVKQSTEDEHHLEETPKTTTKRKNVVGKEKESVGMKYNESLIGAKVKVWWPRDKIYYEGVIDSFDPVKKKHKVLYNDGDEEDLVLKREKWEIIANDLESKEEGTTDQPSPNTSAEMPLKKKAKTSDQSTKQVKVDASPKRGGGRGSSSKSKGVASKSGQKMKEFGKTDGKSMDESQVKKTEDENVVKSKVLKVGGKSADANPKTPGKSRNEDLVSSKSSKSKYDGSNIHKSSKSKQDTPRSGKSKQDTPRSGKSKQDTDKVTPTAKGKLGKSGGKPDVNGTDKLKSFSSKLKETEDVESSADSGKVKEKGKSASLTKGLGSDVKSGKKRRRA